MYELTNLTLSQIHPYVRYVQRFIVTKQAYPVPNKAYDHRLFYVHKGSGRLLVEGMHYNLAQGDLIIWQAGDEYQMVSNKDDELILLGCNFDYTVKNSFKSYPIPPDTCAEFDSTQIIERIHFVDFTFADRAIILHNMQVIEITLQEMILEYHAQKKFFDLRLSSILSALLFRVFRYISIVSDSNGKAACIIDAVIEYIHLHYAENITNVSIGEHFCYHPNYLNKQMISVTGKSLHQYLLSYRIARAIDLISSTNLSISEIAVSVGFKDVCHFTKILHTKTGQVPRSFRTNSTQIKVMQ